MELTLVEAAVYFGLSTEAVRKRVKRGTLPSVRRDGRIYVVVPDIEGGRRVDAADAAPGGRADDPGGQRVDTASPALAGMVDQLRDEVTALRQDQAPRGDERVDAAHAALVEQLRLENARLVEQLAVKDEQLRQANVIIARLSERPLELPARVARVDTTPSPANGATHDATTAEAATATPAPSAASTHSGGPTPTSPDHGAPASDDS